MNRGIRILKLKSIGVFTVLLIYYQIVMSVLLSVYFTKVVDICEIYNCSAVLFQDKLNGK
jgi:hypothetical protein